MQFDQMNLSIDDEKIMFLLCQLEDVEEIKAKQQYLTLKLEEDEVDTP